MKAWLLGALALALALASSAASATTAGQTVPGYETTSGCPSQSTTPCFVPYGSTVPVSGTFTASLGGFTPSTSGARMTPLTVTTSDSSGTLPTGTVVIVSNVGTTNPMYCNVNSVTATTSDQLIPPDSWIALTIPSGVTALHCIATGGSTTANGLGGSGLPTGAGGGSGGSGGSGGLPSNTTPVDCSGTITAGGTAQNAITASSTHHGFILANIDASSGSGEPLWFSVTGTAVAGATASYPLSAPTTTTFTGLTSFAAPFGFNGNVSVIAATTGHKFSCTQW